MRSSPRQMYPLLLVLLLWALLVPGAGVALSAEMTGTITLAGGSTATSSTVVPVTSSVDPAPLEMRFGNAESWTDWAPYATSAEVTVPAGDGLKVVNAEFRDADASVMATSAMITLDTVAPLGDFAVGAGASYTTTTSVIADFNPLLETPVSMRFTTDGGSSWSAWMPYVPMHAVTLTGPDGTKSVTAEYTDAAGNIATVSDSIVLDTTGPTGTMMLNGGAALTNTRTVSVDSAVTDAADMAVSVDGGGAFGSWTAHAAHVDAQVPSGADGARTVVVRYRDAAGNVSERSDSITLDTTAALTTASVAPATADGLNGWYVTKPTVTLSATEQGASMRYKWAAGDTWTSYSSPIQPAEGTHTLYYGSTDAAGNVEQTRTVTFRVDMTEPSGTFTIDGGASQTATTAATAEFAPSGEAPGDMRFSVDGGTTWTSWTAYAPSYGARLPAGDGTKTVKAEYRDAAGNILSASDTIELDATGPAGTMSVDGGAPVTNSRTVSVDSSVTGAVDMALSVDGGATFGAWAPYAASLDVLLPAGADGPRTVVVRYRDAVGNTTDVSDAITLDTAPAHTTASASPADPDGENGWYVTRPTITLGADESGAAVRYKWSSGAGWTSYTGPFPAVEGDTTLYFTSTDAAGNVEQTRTASFKVDLTKPSGTTAIDEGAAYVTTTTATLDSSISGATLMRVNTDGTWPTQWEPYAAHKEIALPASDGERTVAAQFKDQAGNTLEESDSITLDRVAPESVSVTAAGVAGTMTMRATLGAADAVSGIDGYSIIWTTNPAAVPPTTVNVSGSAVTTTSPALQPGIDYYAVARAVDEAGNWSAPKASAKVRFPYPPVTITKAAFSNPVAYELKSFLYTSFYAAVDTSPVDVTLTITRPNKTKLTLVNKKGVTLNGTTPLLYMWNGKDGVTRLPSASYDWELSVTKNGVTTKQTGKLIICKIIFSWKATLTNKAWTTGKGYMQPGSANCYITATTTAPGQDAMYIEVTDPYRYKATAGPVPVSKAAPLNATMRLNSTTGTQILTRSIHTFRVRGNTAYSMAYAFTVIQ